jgi:Ca2+/Na+ antiporter
MPTPRSDLLFDRSTSCTTIFHAHWRSIVLTYGLFNLENLLLLARPWALGLAIGDLLCSSWRGLVLLVVLHALYIGLSVGRQMYDTRCFTAIYTHLVTGLVVRQRGARVEVSQVAARSSLSREIVDFFERDVPSVFFAAYTVIGAVAMLALCDGLLVAGCVLLLGPVYLLCVLFARKTFALNNGLNDQLEREVAAIGNGRTHEVRRHFEQVAQWRIKLSDWQALNFGAMHFLLLVLVTAAVMRCCLGGVEPGQVFATIGYVTMFVGGLANVPMLVQQYGRLRDIRRRVAAPAGVLAAASSRAAGESVRLDPAGSAILLPTA